MISGRTRSLVIFALILAAVIIVVQHLYRGSQPRGEAAAGTRTVVLLEGVKRPLTTAVVSALPEVDRQRFSRQLLAVDNGTIFSVPDDGTDFSSTDVIVFLMDRFSEHPELPFQGVFREVYKELDNVGPESSSVALEISVNESRKMDLVFYNLGAIRDVGLDCIAKHLGGQFSPDSATVVHDFDACRE